MRRITALFTIFSIISISAIGAQKPKLVVNIVVSQMRYDQTLRFARNLSEGGFARFAKNGVVATDARYNFMQTNTPTTLATITTGANPSIHGVISSRWVDYTNNRTVTLIDDQTVKGLDCDAGRGMYSPQNLTVPTLGDKLQTESPKSRVVTIASDPTSAVVMGGNGSQVYWLDDSRGNWISSTAYMKVLPQWVNKYNSLRVATQYLDYNWTLSKHRETYSNSVYSILEIGDKAKEAHRYRPFDFLKKRYTSRDYPKILYTPAANTMVIEFAKQAIIYEDLGKDSSTDILNICFDTPRLVAQSMGSESMEYEDMFYRLDADISDFMEFIFAQIPMQDVLITLTSDHGGSDTYDNGNKPMERFNATQFKVILNGFMSAQYGSGDWVVDYADRQIYLNHNLIFQNNLSLDQVQNRVAAFALQFRGVAHVMTSTAMQTSYFGGGYAQMVQNSFYPKRSGDITINLMPGWIEEQSQIRSLSGSMYEYDTHVPLMMLGAGLHPQRISSPVDMQNVAPTLARIMQISRPVAASGEPIEQIVINFE